MRDLSSSSSLTPRARAQVIAVSSGASKRDFALSIGAHEYIDASSPPSPPLSSTPSPTSSASPTDALVAHLQSRGGARLIVCTAPYADQISALLPAVAKNGTITLVSAATDAPVKVQNLLLNMHRATLRGWCCGGAADMEQCVRFSTVSGASARRAAFLCFFHTLFLSRFVSSFFFLVFLPGFLSVILCACVCVEC